MGRASTQCPSISVLLVQYPIIFKSLTERAVAAEKDNGLFSGFAGKEKNTSVNAVGSVRDIMLCDLFI